MMPRWIKRLTILFFTISLFSTSLLGASSQANAAAQAQPNLDLAVNSAILVEASTGKILYKKNEDVPLPPASMTKMMTEYLVLEAIKNKKIKWTDVVPVSDYAFFIAKMSDSSGVYLNMGEEHTVQELYKAMSIASANDATVLLAEKVGGDEPNFVAMMNKKAQELGMKNTYFVTSSGLPADELGKYTPANFDGKDNTMSARDAAILARALIRDFPEALEISKIPRFVFREGKPNATPRANYNWMLPGLPYEYPGVDGLKTGHTKQAGYCFTGTATRDGMRLISVVMGTENTAERFGETKKLFDYGFSNYKLAKKVDQGAAITGFETAPVKKGVDVTVPAVTGSVVSVLTKTGDNVKVTPTVTFNDLTAPIQKGQVIGKVTFKAEGDAESDYLQPDDLKNAGVDLVAGEDVEKGSWIRLFFRSIIQFIGNLFNGIIGK
ncbi:D-alanyl-D-alanine carboxypeptidase family protein [Brevibacillus massiliensis]|jgi:D-alanyl-D-alanine carboxypeptidase (penicillin-binding protein 5/6)|uniref:D-alanyl-D-alanine carboxypeptidase family protein n=1 Tax=Brevibacillus massiliensis TaxID=1118054 RepID=UPI000315C83C|nr:D-alanyl-D-alanine carboxypeptidase family protein [Brevibacillus massiliensis]